MVELSNYTIEISILSMNPKYREVHPMGSPKLISKAYLQGLQNQVEVSRVAVENITRLASAEQKYETKVGSIQQELQICISNLNNQAKKHRVLIELISLLKGEMFKYQTTKKQEDEAERRQREKQVQKMQYQIDQLLQKHNEEIAKINQLKQIANSRRSERVVYSSLFKKLEREIKYYQEQYKESIIRTEAARNREKALQDGRPSTMLQREDSSQDKKNLNKRISTLKKVSYEPEVHITETNQTGEWNILTSQKCSTSSNEKRKFLQLSPDSFEPNRSSFRNTFHREERIAHTKQTMQQITYYTNLIDKIKIYSEGSSAEQVLQRYGQIEQENKQLMESIKEYDELIEKSCCEKDQIRKKINAIQFEKKYSLEAHASSEGEVQGINDEGEEIQSMMAILQDIGECFKMDTARWQTATPSSILQDDELLEMDTRMSELGSGASEDRVRVREETGMSEAVVEGLLEKMEKFGNCERILDRQLFTKEYEKELSKRKLRHPRK